MSTEPTVRQQPRRLAVVAAQHDAAAGAPPGIDPASFAATCLADTYEVLADLIEVSSGVAGDHAAIADLLWPGAFHAGASSVHQLATQIDGQFDELVVIPADVPDLPGLVVAKVFKALRRADVCVCPERGPAGGCVAIGVRVPWPSWLRIELNLDQDPTEQLFAAAPRRGLVAIGPDWHRLRSPTAIQGLDPGLEGWECTRALLSGYALPSGISSSDQRPTN
jgi:hypothetical protein